MLKCFKGKFCFFCVPYTCYYLNIQLLQTCDQVLKRDDLPVSSDHDQIIARFSKLDRELLIFLVLDNYIACNGFPSPVKCCASAISSEFAKSAGSLVVPSPSLSFPTTTMSASSDGAATFIFPSYLTFRISSAFKNTVSAPDSRPVVTRGLFSSHVLSSAFI